jgi:hypothetical protein
MKPDKIRWRLAAASSLFFYGAMITAIFDTPTIVPILLLIAGAALFTFAVRGLVKNFFRDIIGT